MPPPSSARPRALGPAPLDFATCRLAKEPSPTELELNWAQLLAVDSSRRRRWSTAYAVSGTALKSPQLTALAARCRRSVWWAHPIASPLLQTWKAI